ncbi:MAG TPA: LysE family transporter [Chitinophagaceae bacterium]|nr:LysE family transporter [Chitinophagaceae bacterium]
MQPLFRIFFTGFLISFLGSLPLATMNVAAMQISVTDGIAQALLFSLGSLIVEMIYVRLSLVALNWISRQKLLFRILEFVTLLIVLALAVAEFYAALHPSESKNVVLSSPLPKFVLGATMCALSPGQFPFWLGWSTVLFSKKILLPRNDFYNTYIAGIGIGTFVGNCIFIFGGMLIAGTINANQQVLHWIIGAIFLGTALYQIFKMIKRKEPALRVAPTSARMMKMETLLKRIKKDY